MKKEPTDFHATYSLYGQPSVGCNFDGARYHVWLDRETLEFSETLYKNPPLGVEHRGPGWFATRRLDINSKANSIVVEALKERAVELVAAAKTEEEEKERVRLAAAAEEYRIHRINKYGVELLAALEDMVAAFGDLAEEYIAPDNAVAIAAKARTTIAQAKGEE
jgi:hypothetical protein